MNKEVLQSAGLGEKTLSLDSTATASELHKLILEVFPPLELSGGYQLFRCSGKSKALEILSPPPGGHTPLSISSRVGQSRVYIRPLQRDIAVGGNEQEEVGL